MNGFTQARTRPQLDGGPQTIVRTIRRATCDSLLAGWLTYRSLLVLIVVKRPPGPDVRDS
jgi:hypothetical protein